MYKRIYVLILLLIINCSVATAQNNISNIGVIDHDNLTFAPTDEIENPDEAGVPMPNIGIAEEKPIIEVVEGVGRVQYDNVPFRSGPSAKANVVRMATVAEKVILIGEKDEWFKVIMYNNQEAYILKKYVVAQKIFPDESVTLNSMDKKISFEVMNLITKFNKELQESEYINKYQTRPMVTLEDARKSNNTMSLTFYYYCANKEGRPIPSYKDNDLAPYIRDLFSLIIGRLVISNTENYELIIKIPVFDSQGNVINYNKLYTTITLSLEKVDKEKIRKNNISILTLTESTIPYDKLFSKFPM